MTYNVFGGTLNPAQLNPVFTKLVCVLKSQNYAVVRTLCF